MINQDALDNQKHTTEPLASLEYNLKMAARLLQEHSPQGLIYLAMAIAIVDTMGAEEDES